MFLLNIDLNHDWTLSGTLNIENQNIEINIEHWTLRISNIENLSRNDYSIELQMNTGQIHVNTY